MKYQEIIKVSKNSQQKSQWQVQMRMIKKYLKKDIIFLQKKDNLRAVIIVR